MKTNSNAEEKNSVQASLLMALRDDVDKAQSLLKDDDGHFYRRSVVRSVFGFIEAYIALIKFQVKKEYDPNKSFVALNKKELEILYEEIADKDGVKKSVNIPMVDNFRGTFKIAKKVWGVGDDVTLDCSGHEYNCFLRAKEVRNKITHPKPDTVLDISDQEMEDVRIAYEWFLLSFIKLSTEGVNIKLQNSFDYKFFIALNPDYEDKFQTIFNNIKELKIKNKPH